MRASPTRVAALVLAAVGAFAIGRVLFPVEDVEEAWAPAPAANDAAPSDTDAAPASAELVAERITAENFASRQVGGPDADAGIGDWFLGNGTICAALSDPEHESPLSPRGGVLIDLGHCGRDDDQWAVWQPLLNLSQGEIVPVDSVEAGRDEARAWLRTRARYHGVEIRTTYAVDRATPTALTISLRARRIADGDRLFAIGAIALHPSGQLAAFSLSRANPANSRGFVHPENDRSSTRSLLASLGDADLTVLVAGEGSPPISYGVERVGATLAGDGGASALSFLSITGGHYTLQSALARPPWFGAASGTPGFVQLARIAIMDLDAGDELALDHRLWVGERADVASVTDRIFAEAPLVAGRVDDPAARVHVALESGAPVSVVAPDASGSFALRLPPGRYVAEARAPAGRVARAAFEVAAADEADAEPGVEPGAEPGAERHVSGDVASIPPLVVGNPGWIAVPEGFIGRLVALRADGGGPIRFGDSRLGFAVGDESIPAGIEADWLNVAGAAKRVPVPPGAYRVVAIRGPEYAARALEIEVRPGETTTLALDPLARDAATPGWIGADLHVHSGQSFDSSVPQALQIEAFAAIGAEVLVATEHDRIIDPRPAIDARGLGAELVGVTGSEMTSAFAGGDSPYTTGHLNAFPLTPEPTAFRRGAIRLEGRRLRDALAELRARERPPFVQINHPRPSPDYESDDTYFRHLGVAGAPFDPTKPLSTWPNSVLVERGPAHGVRDLDVEAVELMNAESLVRYRRIRADWFSLLLQGERIVATANSDSHRLGHVVGLPRTYVRMADDRVGAFDEADFVDALRQGRAYGSTGPLLTARLAEAEVGELHAGSKGVLEVSVGGADWIPVAEWRAYVNGELVHRAPIALDESASLPLAFARDAFVTVEVEGPAEGIYRDALPGFVPFAFSNPIFVDADGNGRYDPPGLPALPPKTLTDPDTPD